MAFLDARGVAYEKRPIVDRPPSKSELQRMLVFVGGDMRRLFNTSGELYREMKLSDKLKTLSRDAALDLLAKHGKLIKRPFALFGERAGLVGFDETAWKTALSSR